MAASALTVTTVDGASVVETLASANVDGNYFTNSEKTWFEVLNGSGSSITVTVTFTVDGASVTRAYTVAAGARRKIRFNPSRYNDANSRVNLTYSAVTTVTVGAFALP